MTGGGFCDCGDASAWSMAGACAKHGGSPAQLHSDAAPSDATEAGEEGGGRAAAAVAADVSLSSPAADESPSQVGFSGLRRASLQRRPSEPLVASLADDGLRASSSSPSSRAATALGSSGEDEDELKEDDSDDDDHEQQQRRHHSKAAAAHSTDSGAAHVAQASAVASSHAASPSLSCPSPASASAVSPSASEVCEAWWSSWSAASTPPGSFPFSSLHSGAAGAALSSSPSPFSPSSGELVDVDFPHRVYGVFSGVIRYLCLVMHGGGAGGGGRGGSDAAATAAASAGHAQATQQRRFASMVKVLSWIRKVRAPHNDTAHTPAARGPTACTLIALPTLHLSLLLLLLLLCVSCVAVTPTSCALWPSHCASRSFTRGWRRAAQPQLPPRPPSNSPTSPPPPLLPPACRCCYASVWCLVLCMLPLVWTACCARCCSSC